MHLLFYIIYHLTFLIILVEPINHNSDEFNSMQIKNAQPFSPLAKKEYIFGCFWGLCYCHIWPLTYLIILCSNPFATHSNNLISCKHNILKGFVCMTKIFCTIWCNAFSLQERKETKLILLNKENFSFLWEGLQGSCLLHKWKLQIHRVRNPLVP